jgi:NAD(P)-dependent dehydrogenase (short-subunit alcohol dehydrogenase family)
MGVLDGIAKAACSAALGAAAAHRLAGGGWMAPTAGGLAALVYYMRVWVQDYYWDWTYNAVDRDLRGQTAVVTGGTVGGIGFASAEILHRLGAHVVVTVRTDAKGAAAVAALGGGDRASYVLCDFLDQASIRRCAAQLKTRLRSSQVHFLVLNAGIARSANPADIWQVNHVGPWLFAEEIEPCLTASGLRVVWVSSGAHKRASIEWDNPFDPPTGENVTSGGAYGRSKLANIMHAREFQRRHAGDVKCIAVTPGAVRTNLMRPPAPLLPLLYCITRSPTLGAQVVKMACLDLSLKGGEYLSNCYVKPTEGVDGCSNDEAQWSRLWDMTERHVKEGRFAREKAQQVERNAKKKD